jgi:hypothetical protein
MIGGFYPSKHLDAMYDILEEHQIGIDLYDVDIFDALVGYCDDNRLKFQACVSTPYTDIHVGAFSFIDENNCPQLIMFDYRPYKVKEYLL